MAKNDFDEKEIRYTNQYPSSWIDQRDWLPLELCVSLYTDTIQSKDGWDIIPQGTPSVRAWVNGNYAIVGIMGTSAKTGLSNLLDDAALAGIVDDSCDLAVVNQAAYIIELLSDKEITVAGHSLGGAAAVCLGHKYPVRTVAFNPGAPPTGGGLAGVGFDRCRVYHIVGDVISTHMDDNTAQVSRIYLGGQVNWNNVKFYHSTERFFENRSYERWRAQEEQDSLVKFLYNQSPTAFLITTITGLISKEFNKDRIREIICKNPIPNTEPNCPDIPNPGRTVLSLAGGLVGGFLGGPAGALVGSKAGYDLGGGKGVLDIFAPYTVFGVKQGVIHGLRYGQYVNRTKRGYIR